MNEKLWALLAGLVVIGVGGVFTSSERIAELEVMELDKITTEMTASLVQLKANREALQAWLEKPPSVFEETWQPPRIAQIPSIEWGGRSAMKKELELSQRHIILVLNDRIKEVTELLRAARVSWSLSRAHGSDTEKVFGTAESYCVLELNRRGVKVPVHAELEKVRSQLVENMASERLTKVVGEGYDAAEAIVRDGCIPETIKTESLMTWLAKSRGAKGVLDWMVARTSEGRMRFDVDKATRDELLSLLSSHVLAERLLRDTRDGLLDFSWRHQFLVVEVWINWVLGLAYGGAVVFGMSSLFARKRRVAWKWKGISLVPAVIGGAILSWCYLDHPPSAENPGMNVLWVGAYGGFFVGITSMLLMVFFPALMSAISRRMVGATKEVQGVQQGKT